MFTDLEKIAILIELIDQIRKSRGWCTRNLVQANVYLLQRLFNIDLGHEFVLHKNVPWSFTLDDALTLMKENYQVFFDYGTTRPGPLLVPTDCGNEFRQNFTGLSKIRPHLRAVASLTRHWDGSDIPLNLAALYVTDDLDNPGCIATRADRLRELKPWANISASHLAIIAIDRVIEKARKLSQTANQQLDMPVSGSTP